MIKNRVAVWMLFTISLLPAGTASAGEGGYVGLKFGPMLVDLEGVDDPMNAGFVFGSSKSGGAIEGEFTTSMVKGGIGSADLTITTFAFYGVYRSEGEGGFIKLKGGFLNEDVKAESGSREVSESDDGASFGFGIGSRSENSLFEIEYTIVEQDVNFLSLGIMF